MVFYTKITSVFKLLLVLRKKKYLCILPGISSPLLAMSAAPIPFPFYDFSCPITSAMFRLSFPEENNKSLKKISKLEDPAQHSRLGLSV